MSTIPLTPDNLIQTLSASASGRDEEAEKLLLSWETTSGYLSLLQKVYLDTSLGLNVRWLAVILFKNGVNKYWRSSRPNAVGKEEKMEIRSRLFGVLHEKNNQLVVQNANTIAKIARYDFPAEWPDLVDQVDSLLGENLHPKKDSLIITHNLLIILNRIFKTISMVRVGRARHALVAKAPNLVVRLGDIYTRTFSWLETGDLVMMEICYTALKSLRRIVPECFGMATYMENGANVAFMTDFLRVSVEHLRSMCEAYDQRFSGCDTLVKYVRQYSKLYLSLFGQHPTHFILMPACNDMVQTYLTLLEQRAESVYNSTDDFWETVAIRGLVILKRAVQYVHKRGAVTLKADTDREAVAAALSKLSDDIFAPNVAVNLCDLIIQWYLRLRPSDLESWNDDPEEWAVSEMAASAQWEYSVRACAENFFQDLVKYVPEMGTHVMSRISAGMNNEDPLVRDAVLCCFQLSSSALRANVVFDDVVNDILAGEATREGGHETRILRRRTALILAAWVDEIKAQAPCFALLHSLMTPSDLNDVVVQLTAAQTLHTLVSDWDFDKTAFQPYISDFCAKLLDIVARSEQVDTQMFLFPTLSAILEKCNPLVESSTLTSILGIIPAYWAKAEHIIKGPLIRLLRSLVICMNDSAGVYDLAIPLIANCCAPDTENYAFSEDAFNLWSSILVYSRDNDPRLCELMGLLIPALSNNTEILPTILAIGRSYSLLAPNVFSSDDGVTFFSTLAGFLPMLRDDAFDVLVTVLDVLLLSIPEAISQVLLNSGFFAAIFSFCQDSSQSVPQQNKLLLALSRVAYSHPDILISVASHLGLDLPRFMLMWSEKCTSNGNPRNKKINHLGIITILARNPSDKPLFEYGLKQAFVFSEEVAESNDGSCDSYYSGLTYEDIDDYCYLDENIPPHGEKLRYDALMRIDPVHQVNLLAYLAKVVSGIDNFNDDYVREKVIQVRNK